VIAVGSSGGLRWLLGTFPGGPGLAFDPVNLLNLQFPRFVEITDRRRAPLSTNLVEVVGDRCLVDSELDRNLCLGPALQVKLRDLLTALKYLKMFSTADWH
jgi:hypothetical protein